MALSSGEAELADIVRGCRRGAQLGVHCPGSRLLGRSAGLRRQQRRAGHVPPDRHRSSAPPRGRVRAGDLEFSGGPGERNPLTF
eukprot:3757492-Alexandrium_andersonii.AAC.1